MKKPENMKNIKKILKLGALCLCLLACIGKIQSQLVQKDGSTQEKKQHVPPQVQRVQATSEDKTEDTIEVNGENGYTIMGENGVTKEQMVAYFQASGHMYPSEKLGAGGAPAIEDYCQMFLEEAQEEGVRAEIPYVQSMKETGWLQFKGVCDISQYNFAGIGATGGDVAGESYPDVRTGIRAQVQHLKAYATTDSLLDECVDTRYELVKKASAPYVEWLGQQENPQGVGWAVDSGYGISIAEMIQNLKTF